MVFLCSKFYPDTYFPYHEHRDLFLFNVRQPVRYQITINTQDAKQAIAWTQKFLAAFDLTLLKWVKITPGSKKYLGVYGRCYMPIKGKPKEFKISCQLPGPFPCQIQTRRRPIYQLKDGSFPPVPNGCIRGLKVVSRANQKCWYRIRGFTQLNDINQALVWIIAHESFHFLRATRQVPGRNDEIHADRFADQILHAYQKKLTIKQTLNQITQQQPPVNTANKTTPQPPPHKPRIWTKIIRILRSQIM